jgi:hypothetical protein
MLKFHMGHVLFNALKMPCRQRQDKSRCKKQSAFVLLLHQVFRLRVDAGHEEQRRTMMAASRLTLADELADIRAEIARLQQREIRLKALADDMPVIPVFRRGWPMARATQPTSVSA